MNYRGKTVLVTGHTGFKGSWLCTWLLQLGATVIGYSLPPKTTPNLFERLDLKNKLTHYEATILDDSNLTAVLAKHQPDIIFHLAAQPLVRASYVDPMETYKTNVMGTVCVLETARHCGSVKAVVNVTSDKCYENREVPYAYRESDPMGGFDPYSSSKGCAELVSQAYRRSYFSTDDTLSLATVRSGNVMGGGDWSDDRLVPDCIRSLIASHPISIRYPNAIRPWQHVLEPLSGYLWLGHRLLETGKLYADAWNFGPLPSVPTPVKTIVAQVIQEWGSGQMIVSSEPHPHEAHLLALDISKTAHLLHWEPVYSVAEAVSHTVSWYKVHRDASTPQTIWEKTINDIATYTHRARERNILWAL
ncbi:MAG: CDP-glucose 4,6-dehydratase [Candidatus Margulisiibacteriota bacterium]